MRRYALLWLLSLSRSVTEHASHQSRMGSVQLRLGSLRGMATGPGGGFGGIANWLRKRQETMVGKGAEVLRGDFQDFIQARDLGKVAVTSGMIPAKDAKIFPRIYTTSLSTKRIVIQDEAKTTKSTLVAVAFRMSGGDQIKPWIDAYQRNFYPPLGQVIRVTVNEGFLFKALSGFVQSQQRRQIPLGDHDRFTVYNSSGDPILNLIGATNRLLGYVFLLDKKARLRWHAYGNSTPSQIEELLDASRKLIDERPLEIVAESPPQSTAEQSDST